MSCAQIICIFCIFVRSYVISCGCFRWRMQYKMAELRRWSAEMEQKMRPIAVKLQRWSDEGSRRLAQWWQTFSYRCQRHLDQAKFALMGMYNFRPSADHIMRPSAYSCATVALTLTRIFDFLNLKLAHWSGTFAPNCALCAFCFKIRKRNRQTFKGFYGYSRGLF